MGKDLTVAGSQSVQIAPAASKNQILVLDATLKAAKNEIAEASREGNEILKAMTLAKATQRLRELLTPDMMRDVMALMNTPLGFRTDRGPQNKKNPEPYHVEVVRDVVITAMLDGAKLVGNEFNIIGSNYYRTLEQFERRIREFPGLTDLRVEIGVPVTDNSRGSAIVDMRSSWKLSGKPGRLECCKTADHDTRIPLKIDDYTGVDAILGKARRKFYARLLDHLDGSSFEAQDAALDGTVPNLTLEAKRLPDAAPLATSDAPKEYTVEPDAAPPAAQTKQRVEDFLQDVEATLCSLDSVIDCVKAGDNFKRTLVSAHESGQYTEAEAADLVKIVTGLVESRCTEIRKARGQRKAG